MKPGIGVFDSGVGGLSVLRELRRELPGARVLYYADSAYCPYGARSQADIRARATVITDTLLEADCRLIVVACNTATIAAMEQLRASYPLPFVGMEPAIKPAVAATRSGTVGVLATGAALAGEKFLRLLAEHTTSVRVLTQPCPGLVECVECGELDGPNVQSLLSSYLDPLLAAGADTLVLGCTHYPFLRPAIQRIAGPSVTLLDTGAAVARQVRRVAEREGLDCSGSGSLDWATSADRQQLAPVVERLLALPELA